MRFDAMKSRAFFYNQNKNNTLESNAFVWIKSKYFGIFTRYAKLNKDSKTEILFANEKFYFFEWC